MRNPYYIETFAFKNPSLDKEFGIWAVEGLRKECSIVRHLDLTKLDGEKQEITKTEIPKTITNYFSLALNSQSDKIFMLKKLFKDHIKDQKAMIFFGTCASVEFHSLILADILPQDTLDDISSPKTIYKLHRKIAQKKRTKIYDDFLNGPTSILLTTDISARGLDVPDIAWIVQFDPP